MEQTLKRQIEMYGDAARYQMRRMLPALLSHTMLVVGRLTTDIGDRNATAAWHKDAFTASPMMGQAYISIINSIVEMKRQEDAKGGVFVPLFGQPWLGYQALQSDQMEATLPKSAAVLALWNQLLVAAVRLAGKLAPVTAEDGSISHYTVDRVPLLELVNIYSCPQLKKWQAPNGYRYLEVKGALFSANGNKLDYGMIHAMAAGETIPEDRFMPLLHEYVAKLDGKPPVPRNIFFPKKKENVVADKAPEVTKATPEPEDQLAFSFTGPTPPRAGSERKPSDMAPRQPTLELSF